MCRRGQFDFSGMDWDFISPQAIKLVKSMVEKDPTQRISIEDVLANEWVKNPPRGNVLLQICCYVETIFSFEKYSSPPNEFSLHSSRKLLF